MASVAPSSIDWLIDLARRSKRRLMVRLVKGAYWDSEIKRAQVDGLAGFPVFTRKAHTDVCYLACARKLLAAPDAVFPAIRDAQCADPGQRRSRSPARTSTAGNTSSSACTAWASRSTKRSSAGQARSAMPHLCAGRHPRDAARLSGAPPARERRQLVLRQPHRRPAGADRGPDRRSGRDRPRHAGPARRIRAHRRCRAHLFGAGAPEFDRDWISSNEDRPGATLPRGSKSERRIDWRSRSAMRRRPQERHRPICPCSTRPIIATSSAASSTRGPDDIDAALAAAAAAAPVWAATTRAERAPAACAAPPTRWKPRMPVLDRPDRARGRQDPSPMRSPRCARRSTSCAIMRPRRCAPCAPGARPLGPVVCISPVEFSAGDLHRPGCGSAGGRQSRAGEACRGDAADRRGGGPHAARGRAFRPTRCSSSRAPARSVPRWSAIPVSRASCSPAPPPSRV